MFRFSLVLALGVAYASPALAQACSCEIAWEKIVTATWQGQAMDQMQIDGLGCINLRYLRNVPYGRHGYTFTQPWITKQFAGDPRYMMDEYITDQTVEGVMTPGDRYNVDLIVAQEEAMDCTTWWRENGETVKDLIVSRPVFDVPVWQQPEEPVVVEEPIVEDPKSGYIEIQEMYVGSDGITYITIGEANPALLVERALKGRMIEDAWLQPLSCVELDRVESALYARYGVGSVQGLTPEIVAARHFESVDKLTLLRVDRAQVNKHCEES